MHYKNGSKAEVWEAVKAAGMAEDIKRISAAFDGDIADIAVIKDGVCTYLHNKPQNTCVSFPARNGQRRSLKPPLKTTTTPGG